MATFRIGARLLSGRLDLAEGGGPAARGRAPGLSPSLDGCGERKGSVRPGITTESQADEVAQLLFYEDLKDVVLVGTSSGGMVVCRAAELMRDRVGRIALVDALALFNGEKIGDIVTRSTAMAVAGGLTRGPAPRTPTTRLFADLDPATRAWALERYTPHPIGIYDQPVKLELVLVAAVEGECHLVPPRAKPGRSASAPRRRAAQRQLGRARYRALPDAEHARGADPAAAGRLTVPAQCRHLW